MDDLLAGKLAYVFYASIVDATILSLIALVWFRRSMRGLMQSGSGVAAAGADMPDRAAFDGPPAASVVPARLSFALYGPGKAPVTATSSDTHRPARRRLVIAYTLGAAAYAIVLTSLRLGTQHLPFVAWLVRGWVEMWPLVPSLVALLAVDRRSSVRLAGAYLGIGLVAVFAVTLGGQLLRGTLNAAPLTNLYWMLVSLALVVYAPLALIVVSGWRRIRAIMPLAIAGTVAFGFALLAFGSAMVRILDVGGLRSALLDAGAVVSVTATYYGLFLVASLPVGWVIWRLLRRLARAFERKRFSDVQLIVDCWWAIVAAEQATLLSTELGYYAVAGALAAFAAYRIVVAVALRMMPAQDQAPQRLLLLRVFGYQSRTESLFDRIAHAWRFDGPVHLIAGADLASRSVTPGLMLRFLSGTLEAQYVATGDDVAARIGALDAKPDPDGRFRVNDVYCRNDIWHAALVALLAASDRVLMDVRSFSTQNQGCVFELEQLLLRLPTQAIVLLIDAQTDVRLLGSTLCASWSRAREGGRARGDGTLALVKVERNRPGDLRYVAQRLRGGDHAQALVVTEEIAEAAKVAA